MIGIGLTLTEVATLLGIISMLVAAGAKGYTMVQTHISAPLIVALDQLRCQIGQLENVLVTGFNEIDEVTDELQKRVKAVEKATQTEEKAGQDK